MRNFYNVVTPNLIHKLKIMNEILGVTTKEYIETEAIRQ